MTYVHTLRGEHIRMVFMVDFGKYENSGQLAALIEELDKNKRLINGTSLEDWVRARNQEAFRVDFIYNTNAIEGNTLTLGETALVVNENITIAEKSLVCHLEAVGLAHAFDFVERLAKNERTLTEFDIKQIHSLVLADKPEHKGVYRNVSVFISGSNAVLCEPLLIPERMRDLLYNYQASERPTLAKIAEFHVFFEQIHPFRDGNGRTGRLLLNLLLLRDGYLPINIKFTDRRQYMQSLETAQTTGDTTDFVQMVLSLQLLEQKRRLKQIEEQNGS